MDDEMRSTIYEVRKSPKPVLKTLNRNDSSNILYLSQDRPKFTMVNGHLSPRRGKFNFKTQTTILINYLQTLDVPRSRKRELSGKNFISRYNDEQTQTNLKTMIAREILKRYKKASNRVQRWAKMNENPLDELDEMQASKTMSVDTKLPNLKEENVAKDTSKQIKLPMLSPRLEGPNKKLRPFLALTQERYQEDFD